MNMIEFEVLCLSKSVGRMKEFEKTIFFEKTYSALKRVALDTLPLILHINYPQGQQILRKIDENSYIRFPRKPQKVEDELDIDMSLVDATAYMVMASYETQRAKIYMGLYYTEIENNNSKLIETDLVNTTNDNFDETAVGEFV